MRHSTIVKIGLVVCSCVASGSTASAQVGSRIFGRNRNVPDTGQPREVQSPTLKKATPVPAKPQASASAAPTDAMVLPSNSTVPEPLKPEEMAAPAIALPSGPIEPYLLKKDDGPFMVLAHTFRGPNAERYALALVMELRSAHNLPAFILRTKDMPGRSNIRNVPPTAPEYMRAPQTSLPERIRTEDEAAVLVGNEKSLENSEKLLKQVKKIHPKCLETMPSMWSWRKGIGLSRAIRTTNPYVPAEMLYPRKQDMLVEQMNGGPHSVNNCPGQFSLQIAEFTGRTTFDTKTDKRFLGMLSLKSSPLATAHEDAEKLAASLVRDKDFVKLGYQPYVFHDRFSSKVFVGGFKSPNDPGAVKLRESLNSIASALNNNKTADVLIVPALALTDLNRLKNGDVTDVQVKQTARSN